jgi:hypothetical protein
MAYIETYCLWRTENKCKCVYQVNDKDLTMTNITCASLYKQMLSLSIRLTSEFTFCAAYQVGPGNGFVLTEFDGQVLEHVNVRVHTRPQKVGR